MLDAPRSTAPSVNDDRGVRTRARVHCRACAAPVARLADRVEVGHAQLHTFVNPGGEVFELTCFSTAAGAIAEGQATLEFTWFPGHAWSFARCRQCGAQLGWRYTGAQRFWGLIRSALRWP